MAARFRRKVLHQESHDHSAGDRHQNDQRAPRAGRCEDIGVVIDGENTEEGDVMDQSDKSTKEYGSEPGNDADDDGEKRQSCEPNPRWKPQLHSH